MLPGDTYKREEEDKRKGFIVSFIIHSLLLLLFFLPLIQAPLEIQESSGILIAFGEPDAGDNDAPTESNEVESQQQTAAAAQSSASKNNESSDVASTIKEEEAPIKSSEKEKKTTTPVKQPDKKAEDKKATDAKAKAESDKKSKAAAEKAAADKAKADKEAEQANTKKKFSDLFGAGAGNNKSTGNQGQQSGDPDGKVLDGISKGSGRVGGGLSGRGVEYEPTFSDNSQKTGKVSLSICVGKNGTVSKADFTQKGSTTSDAYLIDLARKTALKYKFSKSEIESQCGTVTIDFKVQ